MSRTHKIIETKNIIFDRLYFQYVPERFEKAFSTIPSEETLHMSQLPHCDLLKQYIDLKSLKSIDLTKTGYYKIHQAWGRNEKFIRKKIGKFIGLFESISKQGLKEPILVLREPLYKKFHSGYEIYEGHHRVSVCFVLGHKSIKAKVIKFT